VVHDFFFFCIFTRLVRFFSVFPFDTEFQASLMHTAKCADTWTAAPSRRVIHHAVAGGVWFRTSWRGSQLYCTNMRHAGGTSWESNP